MKTRSVSLIFILVFTVSGCVYPGITGRVIDAETQQPIEGAVVMVEWTKKHGLGDPVTESYKVVEAISDKDGKVKIEGCYSPFVERPDVTVYKKGYVAWSSRWIFPGFENREEFTWFKFGDHIFMLEHFKPEYSYVKHTSFIDLSINISLGGNEKRSILKDIRWEEIEASKERTKRDVK